MRQLLVAIFLCTQAVILTWTVPPRTYAGAQYLQRPKRPPTDAYTASKQNSTGDSSAFVRTSGKDTCIVGMYVQNIYDLDYLHSSFGADLWMWFLTKSEGLRPLKSVTVANAKESLLLQADVEKKAGWEWSTQECKAVIGKNWQIENFPFDHQQLEIILEDAQRDTTSLTYIADSLESRCDRAIKLDGWIIDKMLLRSVARHYETNYGDPTLEGGSTYPAVVATIGLRREGFGLFIKMFVGVYVAFLISIAAFFFNSGADVRFSLAVGALFAAVANKYIADSYLPTTVQFTLVDKIHALTFVFIMLTIFISIFEMIRSRRAGAVKAERFDRIVLMTSMVVYIGVNTFFIVKAVL